LKKIEVGSVVLMNSGGPRMTVRDRAGDRVQCIWFDAKNRLHTGSFDVVTLRVRDDNSDDGWSDPNPSTH
jgi:uncharacterized protein YodC (DUF2158 family)